MLSIPAVLPSCSLADVEKEFSSPLPSYINFALQSLQVLRKAGTQTSQQLGLFSLKLHAEQQLMAEAWLTCDWESGCEQDNEGGAVNWTPATGYTY